MSQQDRSRKRKEQRLEWKRFKESIEEGELQQRYSAPEALLTPSVIADTALSQSTSNILPNALQVLDPCHDDETAVQGDFFSECVSEEAQFEGFQELDCFVAEASSSQDSETESDSSSDSDQSPPEEPLDLTEFYKLLEEVDKEDELPDSELSKKLATWTLKHNVTHSHVDDLLSILRGEGHPNLKKNIKAILKTPRRVRDLTQPLGRGMFYYRGLFQALLPFLSADVCERQSLIAIDVFVDGLSPYKSVKRSVWPIVGSIVDSEVPRLFVIAVWCGASKDPGDIKEFLREFVEEAKMMIQGFTWNEKPLQLKIRHYIADAPARSFLRCVLVHNSYDSCERCTCHGQWQGRVIFPHGAAAEPRTDATFQCRDHPVYHTGASPLEELGTGMVTQFPLDGMHLIYLGVMKRLLSMLLKEKKASIHKLNDDKKSELDHLMKSYSPFCPSEFSRKPRPISEYKYYKAHELRRILLYDGVLIYNDLPSVVRKNFLLLHCAIRILSDQKMIPFYDDADYLLKKFVENAGSRDVYGPSFRVYNVHHLTHFAEECKRCGPIEEFSAFKYENYIGSLKKLLKAPGRTLSQIVARTFEKARNLPQSEPKVLSKYQLAGPHNSGPVCQLVGQQFKKVVVQGLQLSTSVQDSCCIMKNKDIVVIENIVKTNDAVWIVGRSYHNKEDMYVYPMQSSLLGIYKVSRPMPSSTWKISEVEQKCMRLPILTNQVPSDSYLCIPLLQHFES